MKILLFNLPSNTMDGRAADIAYERLTESWRPVVMGIIRALGGRIVSPHGLFTSEPNEQQLLAVELTTPAEELAVRAWAEAKGFEVLTPNIRKMSPPRPLDCEG